MTVLGGSAQSQFLINLDFNQPPTIYDESGQLKANLKVSFTPSDTSGQAASTPITFDLAQVLYEAWGNQLNLLLPDPLPALPFGQSYSVTATAGSAALWTDTNNKLSFAEGITWIDDTREPSLMQRWVSDLIPAKSITNAIAGGSTVTSSNLTDLLAGVGTTKTYLQVTSSDYGTQTTNSLPTVASGTSSVSVYTIEDNKLEIVLSPGLSPSNGLQSDDDLVVPVLDVSKTTAIYRQDLGEWVKLSIPDGLTWVLQNQGGISSYRAEIPNWTSTAVQPIGVLIQTNEIGWVVDWLP